MHCCDHSFTLARIRLRRWGGTAIVNENKPMRAQAVFLVIAVLLVVSPASAQDRDNAKEQVEFGIKVAQTGLWREAQYRWERAVQLDPTYSEAWNNLAIAYEHAGRFDDARKAYETAIKLDPKNVMIQQNYELFKEINDRTQKRRGVR